MVKLDESLTLFQDLILEMARKVRSMHSLALDISESGDREKALTIIRMDDFVNNYEEEINDRAQESLALLSPVATDLRIVIAGIKMASDIERIGDYAKNIAEYVIKNGPLDETIVGMAQEIGEHFLTMYDHAMEAYKNRDVKAAFEIPLEDEKINEIFTKMIKTLDDKLQSGKPVSHILQMVAMLRNFERSGDHTKNLCEHVIYQVKGQHYDFD